MFNVWYNDELLVTLTPGQIETILYYRGSMLLQTTDGSEFRFTLLEQVDA